MTSAHCGPSDTALFGEISTGVLFRNPKPYWKSIHAYFPSVAVLPGGEMVAVYTLGEAFEATNLHLNLARSSDAGQTWHHVGRLTSDQPGRLLSDSGRIAVTPDGQLVVNLMRHDRTDYADFGLANPQNLGFVPTRMLLIRSGDGGRSWDAPEPIEPPLVGPEFELCSPITILRDGRWLLPTSTWRDWDGRLPNGNRMVALVSHDQGRTWPSYLDVMHSPDNELIFWESKIVEFPDGRLLAVAWCYDEAAGRDRPNHYSLSFDGGNKWTPYRSTGLSGQTMTPYRLGDRHVLCVYRRTDQPGLWANVSRLDRDEWVNMGERPLWGYRQIGATTAAGPSMVENFQNLKFGAPSIVTAPDGCLFVTFWCYEDNVSIIRWLKFPLPPVT